MQNHLYLARIPEGNERDYVRGLLKFYHNDNKVAGTFMYLIVCVIGCITWGALILGIIRMVNGDVPNIIALIFMLLFNICISMVIVVGGKDTIRRLRPAEFNNIRVWDVMITNVESYHSAHGTGLYLGTVLFRDGTPGITKYRLELYSSQGYTYGLIVAVYNTSGELIQTKLIPQMGYHQKAERLSKKGFLK